MFNKNAIFLSITLLLGACQTAPQPVAPAVAPKPEVQSPTESRAETTAEKNLPPQPSASAPQQKLHQQALDSIKAGDIDKAIKEFKQIIAAEPTLPHAYTNLGLLYLHQNRLQEAAQAFQQAIVIDNKDAVAYNNLAVIQRRQGKFKKALFNYYKAVKNKPDYAAAHLNLGILLDLYLPDLPKALEHYQTYQKLTGGNNEKVKKWIIDLQHRIKAGGKQ